MSDMLKVSVKSVQWAVEAAANAAIEQRDEHMALHAIRLYDALKRAGHDSAVGCVLPELARLAHVDL